MNKRFTTIEHVDPPKRKSILLPVVGIAVLLLALLWIGEHWAGDCLSLDKAFTFCEVHKVF